MPENKQIEMTYATIFAGTRGSNEKCPLALAVQGAEPEATDVWVQGGDINFRLDGQMHCLSANDAAVAFQNDYDERGPQEVFPGTLTIDYKRGNVELEHRAPEAGEILTTIPLNQAHIDAGRPKDWRSCPVALALTERFGRTYQADILQSNSTGSPPSSKFTHGESVRKFVTDFDTGQPVLPGTLTALRHPGEDILRYEPG